MIKAERFKLHHIIGFEPRDGYENIERDMRGNLADPTRDLVSIMFHDSPIAIVGLNHLRPGVGEVWLICSKKVNEIPLEFFKFVDTLINVMVMDLMGLHRVQMGIDCRLPRNVKWAKSLGFIEEGIMKKYDKEGNDHYLFAKVR